jgi:acyl dehydratase
MKPIDDDVAQMTRRTIVRYAGAVQDFNPVHYDDEFAKKMGLPAIIAQGPLTVTLLLDAAVAAAGAGNVTGIKARLKAPVFPGDQLHLKCDAEGTFSASVGGKEVVSGSVSVKG